MVILIYNIYISMASTLFLIGYFGKKYWRIAATGTIKQFVFEDLKNYSWLKCGNQFFAYSIVVNVVQ